MSKTSQERKEAETADTFDEDDYKDKLIDQEYSDETAATLARKKKEKLAEKIEIDLSMLKDERGTHVGPVKVTRGGKTFYQQRRVGQKDKEVGSVKITSPAQIKKILKEAGIKLGSIRQTGSLHGMSVKKATDYAIKIKYMRPTKVYQVIPSFPVGISKEQKREYGNKIIKVLNDAGVRAKYEDAYNGVEVSRDD